jgi:hypothetical protein
MNLNLSGPLKRLARLMCLSLCFGLAVESAIAQESSHDLKMILSDWQRRRERTRTARYVLEGEMLVPKGAFNGEHELYGLPAPELGDIPKADRTLPVKLTLVFDSQNNRLRKEKREQAFRIGPGMFSPNYCVQVFDGKSTKSYMPKADNESEKFKRGQRDPDLFIVKQGVSVGLDFGDYPLLLSQGIVRPWPLGLSADQLLPAPSLEQEIRVHSHGVLRESDCLILRSTESKDAYKVYDEFWIDPTRESAVVRAERYQRGRLSKRVDTRYQETGHGWLPESWTYTLFKDEDPDRFWATQTLRVKEYAINERVSPTLFDFDMRPGMLVTIAQSDTDAKPRDYRVAEDGLTLIPASDVPAGSSLGRKAWWLQMLALAILACIVSLWWLRRRARERKAGPKASQGLPSC